MRMIKMRQSRSFIACLCALTVLAGCVHYGERELQHVDSQGAFFDYTELDPERYSYTYDVVVVGAGLAGLSAAVTAAEAGASVIVVEKMAGIGGNSIYSNGTFNAVDPLRQSAQGIEDSLELFIKQTYDGGGRIGNLDLIALLCEKAGDARDWLAAHGSTWSEQGVYLSTGGAWPRSLDAAYGANESFIRPLAESVVAAGGSIVRDLRVISLVCEGETVIGARAVNTLTGEEHVFWTDSVVLATGGFGANLDMIAEYCGDIPENVETETTPAATGDGILLALRTGAALVDMEYVQMVPGAVENGLYFTSEISSSIYVNKNGERFVSEQLSSSELCQAILDQPDQIAYAIFDSNTISEDFVDNTGRNTEQIRKLAAEGLCGYGETLQELAENLGLDPATFLATIEEFNRTVDGETVDPFGRELFYKKISSGPFYASIRTAKVHYTMGGLRIDTRARVLNKEGRAIPGLYAAGEVTGGIHGTNHVTGNALADCVVFGRIAGASAWNKS